MIDLHLRVCRLDTENAKLRAKINAALDLIGTFSQRYVDRWDDDDTEHVVIHDHAYYDERFLPDLIALLEDK